MSLRGDVETALVKLAGMFPLTRREIEIANLFIGACIDYDLDEEIRLFPHDYCEEARRGYEILNSQEDLINDGQR